MSFPCPAAGPFASAWFFVFRYAGGGESCRQAGRVELHRRADPFDVLDAWRFLRRRGAGDARTCPGYTA